MPGDKAGGDRGSHVTPHGPFEPTGRKVRTEVDGERLPEFVCTRCGRLFIRWKEAMYVETVQAGLILPESWPRKRPLEETLANCDLCLVKNVMEE